jgi:hypothetical protein
MGTTKQWFYGTPETKLGPVPQLALVAMARARKLAPTTLVWTEGMPKWVPAGALPFLFANNPDHGALNLLLPLGAQSGFAIAAGYLGLLSMVPVVALVIGPLAIIFGFLARADLEKHPEKRGHGRAITGIAIGSFGLLINGGLAVAVSRATRARVAAPTSSGSSRAG